MTKWKSRAFGNVEKSVEMKKEEPSIQLVVCAEVPRKSTESDLHWNKQRTCFQEDERKRVNHGYKMCI